MNKIKIKTAQYMSILSGIIISLLINPVYGLECKDTEMLSPRIAISSIDFKSSADSLIKLNKQNEDLAAVLVNLSDEQVQVIQNVNSVTNENGETYFRARSRKTKEWTEFVIRPLTDTKQAEIFDNALQSEGVKHFSWANNLFMKTEAEKFDKKGLIYAVYQLDADGNDLRIVAAGNGFIEKPGYKTEKYLHTYNVEVLLSARNEFSGIGTKLFVKRISDTLRKENIGLTQGRAFFTAASDTAVDRSPYTFYTKLGLNPAIGREKAEEEGNYKHQGTDFDLSLEDVVNFLDNQFLGYAPNLETLRSQELVTPSSKEENISKVEKDKNKALEIFNRVTNSKTYASLQRVFNYDDTVFPYRAVYVGPVKNIERVEEFLGKSIKIFEQIISRFEGSLENSDKDIIQMHLNDLYGFSSAMADFKQTVQEAKAVVLNDSAASEAGTENNSQEGIEVPDYIMNMLNAKSDTSLVDQAAKSALRTEPMSDLITLDLIDSAI